MFNKNCGCHHKPMHNHYQKPCPQTKVINKYHVECEKVEVPVHTHIIHHKIKKPMYVPVPMCTEEIKEHPFNYSNCGCKMEQNHCGCHKPHN